MSEEHQSVESWKYLTARDYVNILKQYFANNIVLHLFILLYYTLLLYFCNICIKRFIALHRTCDLCCKMKMKKKGEKLLKEDLGHENGYLYRQGRRFI